VREKSYNQVALVANFVCDKPHRNIARQWFNEQSILAWLPLGAKNISIVWSTTIEHGQTLLEMEPHAFSATVNAAAEHPLGELTLASPVACFPLRSLRSETMVNRRVALMGDAAHILHPLAGQGLNLGLQDALVMAKIIASRPFPEGVGDLALLRRFERARAEPIAAMHGITNGLQWLFASESKTLVNLRSAGMGLTNKLPALKKLLIGHAIG
jgi:2-polyprenylphenol 6-hydroxylase